MATRTHLIRLAGSLAAAALIAPLTGMSAGAAQPSRTTPETKAGTETMRGATAENAVSFTSSATDLSSRTPIRTAFWYTRNCSWGTCSVYLTRGTTKALNQKLSPYRNSGPAAITGAAAAACSPGGPWMVGVCSTTATIYGTAFINTLKTASSRNECVRIRTLHNGTVVGLYNDNSKYCKN